MFQLPSLVNVDTGIERTTTPKLPLLTHLANHDYLLHLDNSTTEVFQTCPRAARYHCIDRRVRQGRAALIFGGAIHKALEYIYLTSFSDLHGAKVKCLRYMEKENYSPGSDWRTPELALITIEQYFNFYSLADAITPIVHNAKTMVEIPFELEVGDFHVDSVLPFTYGDLGVTAYPADEPAYINKLHFAWTGKIDIGAYIDNEIHVVDHKTTSMGGDTFFNDFTLSQQTVGYCWALSKLLSQPVNNFTLNALIIRKPTRTGAGTEFERRPFFYPPAFINEWTSDIFSSCESFVFSLLHDNFPKHTKWCMGKYGACQYHPVCSSLPEARQFVLSTDSYTNVTWSPLND